MGLIDRFQNKYGVILYSKRTSEIAIKNYLRHGIVKGGKPIADCLISDINRVKDKELINDVFEHVINYKDLNPTVLRVISNYINGNGQEQDQEQDNDNGNGQGHGHGHGVTSPLTGNVTGYDTQNKNKGTEKKSGNPFMSFAKGGL